MSTAEANIACMRGASVAVKAEKNDSGAGGGVGNGESLKRKGDSTLFTTSAGEIDLSTLPLPRAGRPLRSENQDPAMQEARKRARVLRNRAAAQLSREKKRMHVEQLEQENDVLRAKNEELEERLSRAEDANADLSSRLDSLAKQLQSFQSLVMGASQGQQQLAVPRVRQSSLTSPIVDWSSIATPLVASPTLQGYVTPGNTPPSRSNSTDSVLSFTNATALNNTASLTPTKTEGSSGPAILSSLAGTTLSSPASIEPTSAAMELFPTTVTAPVAAAADLSDKGLSESAVLEQSGAHIYCVVPDSQQRRPLSTMQSISRKLRRQSPFSEAASAAATAAWGTCSSTSSSKSWGQRMANMAVMAVVSAAPSSSPRVLWTIFCALWWIISQHGGSISRHQLSRIARGILDCPRPATDDDSKAAATFVGRNSGRKARAFANRWALSKSMLFSTSSAPSVVASEADGLASLRLVAAWLEPGTRTAAALRRVAGDEPVDQVGALVTRLYDTALTMGTRNNHRRSTGNLTCNKKTTLFYSPF
ncbi:hypothetical protein GGI07_003648 [Coemansia sp. Benny D115]|nr:hypothetical protein GGI07_003648 [Coemansia sp. Benny D115]